MALAPSSSRAGGAAGVAADGWVDDGGETWTRTAATTFTVPTDLTAQYPAGTLIRLTQTTTKYFVVASSAHAGGTTTVTVTGGSDYTLAAAAITGNAHSYEAKPQGFPGWFNWVPVWTGFSADPTVLTARFRTSGRACTMMIMLSGHGTSNATTLTFTAPLPADVIVTGQVVMARDNGVALTTPGYLIFVTPGSAVASCFKDLSAAAWTASGSKSVQGIWTYGF